MKKFKLILQAIIGIEIIVLFVCCVFFSGYMAAKNEDIDGNFSIVIQAANLVTQARNDRGQMELNYVLQEQKTREAERACEDRTKP